MTVAALGAGNKQQKRRQKDSQNTADQWKQNEDKQPYTCFKL